MKKITLGIIADVDAGKTTLSEALLYLSGSIRSFGRVDKGESFLDSNELERRRGITIFSKQARFSFGETEFVLIDTPGHADFSAETERTLAILDYALLIISAPEGISGQTRILWKLLQEYEVPVFVFFNKMDQIAEQGGKARGAAFFALDSEKERLLRELGNLTDSASADFSAGNSNRKEESFFEAAALASEEAMEEYLETGAVCKDTLRREIKRKNLVPVFFGSALKQEGVEGLLAGLDEYCEETVWPEEFSAAVYKIARDPDGSRLTFLRITGGTLKVRTNLPDGKAESKITQIRLYSGDRFTPAEAVNAGDVCAVCGLKESRAGQILGAEKKENLTENAGEKPAGQASDNAADRTAKSNSAHAPILTPVLSYRVLTDRDSLEALPIFRILEEESPELSVFWEENRREIHIQVMGTVQLEILTSILKERFGLEARFDSGEVLYQETIKGPVLGAGHFEPLRHYAEVHLLMEPLPRGSGLVFESRVSTDRLAKNWQRLILTHLAEKRHRGVLTGAPVTDMKITVVAGKAHLKHTEGGDFRQATYRAVRQGLMMAESILLEPFYHFSLEVPTETVGRVLTDLDRMNAQFQPPEVSAEEGMSHIEGRGPVAALKDYPAALASFSRNRSRVSFVPDGYGPCHNTEEVIEKKAYDPLTDLRNSPDSVFCANGSGYIVPYDEVYDHLDVEFEEEAGRLRDQKERTPAGGSMDAILLSSKEIDSIIAAYASANRGKRKKTQKKSGSAAAAAAGKAGLIEKNAAERARGAAPSMGGSGIVRTREYFPFEQAEILLVDGYNVIFAWEELNKLAKESIDAARIALIDHLSKYSAMVPSEVIVVFDAYRVKGRMREDSRLNDIRIIFTKEDETADQFIEKFANGEGKKKRIAVVTSDAAEQQITGGQGGMILSSREFRVRYENMIRQWNEQYNVK